MIVVENGPTQDCFSKVSIYNCLGRKNMKKGYIEMAKTITLRPLRSFLGRSIFHYLLGVTRSVGAFTNVVNYKKKLFKTNFCN